MIIRQSLNFAVHLAAGLAVGALAVAALSLCRRRRDDDWLPAERPQPEKSPDAPS